MIAGVIPIWFNGKLNPPTIMSEAEYSAYRAQEYPRCVPSYEEYRANLRNDAIDDAVRATGWEPSDLRVLLNLFGENGERSFTMNFFAAKVRAAFRAPL